MLAILKGLVDLRNDHLKLCTEAHCLRRNPTVRAFLRERRSKYDLWFRIHHYLARLGSWNRAAHAVVELARQFTDVLTTFGVRRVLTAPNLDRAPLDFDADPGAVLARVCPNYKDATIFANALSRLQKAKTLAERYQRVRQTPKPHAETKILHYFFQNGVEFARGDRYIGCSKPSCYSCARYLRFHPMRARTGRTHDNIWIKWCLPSALLEKDGAVHRHCLRMMLVLADSIRSDIIGLILGEDTPVGAMFDSTTGLTASVRALSC